MTAFAFTTTGQPSAVCAAISAAPASTPAIPQAVADAIVAQIAPAPDSLTATATITGDLGWVTNQIAGTLALSVLIHIA